MAVRWSHGVRLLFGVLLTAAGSIGGALVFTRLGTAPFLGPLGLAVGGVFGASLGFILSEPS